MTLHPQTAMDLVLAPVAAEIDENLQRIRDKPNEEIAAELALALDVDVDVSATERDDRAELVRKLGEHSVQLHGWQTKITEDFARLHVSGGSVSLDLGLGTKVTQFIESGF
jgi:hypothetical protein